MAHHQIRLTPCQTSNLELRTSNIDSGQMSSLQCKQILPQIPSMQATSFTCFEKLPPELRAEVWKHAAVPRTIKIVSLGITRDHNAKPANRETPMMMKVCRESRHVGKKIYRRCFRRTFHGDWIWFSWDFDTLYFTHEGAFIDFFRGHYYDRTMPIPPIPRDILRIQSKLSHVAINGRGDYFEALFVCLAAFEKLKTLEIQKITPIGAQLPDEKKMDTIKAKLQLAWSRHTSFDTSHLPTFTWMEDIMMTMRVRHDEEKPWVFGRQRPFVEYWEANFATK